MEVAGWGGAVCLPACVAAHPPAVCCNAGGPSLPFTSAPLPSQTAELKAKSQSSADWVAVLEQQVAESKALLDKVCARWWWWASWL